MNYLQLCIRNGMDGMLYVSRRDNIIHTILTDIVPSYQSVLLIVRPARISSWTSILVDRSFENCNGEFKNGNCSVRIASVEKLTVNPDNFPCSGLLIVEGLAKLRSMGKMFQCILEKRLLSRTILVLNDTVQLSDVRFLARLFQRDVDVAPSLEGRVLLDGEGLDVPPCIVAWSAALVDHVHAVVGARRERDDLIRRQNEEYRDTLLQDTPHPSIDELRHLRCRRFDKSTQ